MIQFSEVYKTYPGGQEALKHFSLQIESSEFTFVTGHSGAGKSTLLRLIALIERQTRGQILIDGQNLERIPPRQTPYYRRKIGFIFQDHRLLFDRSVFDNVALPLAIAGLKRAETAKRVRAALDRVGLLSKEKRNPMMLSAGEQQRVGIARAVVHKPDILLADEPTGNLDADLAIEIMRLFERFNQVGVTVVIATHHLELLGQFGHRIIALKNGELYTDTRGDVAVLDKDLKASGDGRAASAVRSRRPLILRSWLAAHRQALASVISQWRRAPLSHVLTTAVIGFAFALPLGLYVILYNIQELGESWDRTAARISLYLKTSVDDPHAVQFAASLNGRPGVAAVELISRQEALNEYRSLSGFTEALNALEDNPLPALVLVDTRADDVAVDRLMDELKRLPEVDVATLDTEWLQRLKAIMKLARQGVLVLALLLAVAVLLIVGHAIRLGIMQRRDEIEISKLFGATNAYIRRPLLYTGLAYGLGGGVLACLLVAAALFALHAPVRDLASLYNSNYALRGLPLASTITAILGSAALGWFAAWWTSNRALAHLDVH